MYEEWEVWAINTYISVNVYFIFYSYWTAILSKRTGPLWQINRGSEKKNYGHESSIYDDHFICSKNVVIDIETSIERDE